MDERKHTPGPWIAQGPGMTLRPLLERLDGLYKAATPGEWAVQGHRIDALQFYKPSGYVTEDGREHMDGLVSLTYRCHSEPGANDALIAELHNAYPQLRAALAEQEQMREALTNCVGALGDACHATAIYGDQPPQLYLDALDAARRALALRDGK